jgi:hypothetical protein
VERSHKRLRKKNSAIPRNALTVEPCSINPTTIHQNEDLGQDGDIDIVNEVEDVNLDDQIQVLDSDDKGEVGIPNRRRSNRQITRPSRFANAITIGVQLGRMFSSDQSWNNLCPLKTLPNALVTLEQDVKSSSHLSRPEITKLRELHFLDSMNNADWDPHRECAIGTPIMHAEALENIPTN